MARPTDWSSLGYGSDPVPGDHSRVDLIGRMYEGTADSILSAAQKLTEALKPEFGQSEAIDAIREVAGDVADRVGRAETRYRKTGEAIVAYAASLRVAQEDSLAALTSGDAAESTARNANNMANYYQRQIDDPNTPPANVAGHTSSQSAWQSEANSAAVTLANAITTLQGAISKRDGAAAIAIDAIDSIGDSGKLNDSDWDNVVQWVRENKEIIDLIVDIVGYIATAVMIVALFIPGLNAIVGLIALIATIVTLANVALQVAAGTMGPVEAILNVALAALTFVGGRAIGSAINGVEGATRSTVGASIRSSYAGSGISGMTRARAVDMVDTAANVSRRRQLSILERLQFLTLDFKQISQIRNIANIELLSGAHATGAAAQMERLARLSGLNAGLEAAGFVGDRVISSVTANEQPLPWRAGNNW